MGCGTFDIDAYKWSTNLDETRVVMVASLMAGFKVNFEFMIVDEMHTRATKTTTSLPFPCLAIELCRLAKVPILNVVDDEMVATKPRTMIEYKMT